MEGKWVILGTNNCVYCKKVETMFHNLGVTYIYYNIDPNPVLKDFVRSCGLTTVPQVYLNGYLIGGYDETNDYIRNFLSEEFQ